MTIQRKSKPKIIEIVKTTPCGFHSWVKVIIKGEKVVIRKENKNIPDRFFDEFFNRKVKR